MAETPSVYAKLDGWINRRLRMVRLKQWKHGRRAYKGLRAKGVNHIEAATAVAHMLSWWKTSNDKALCIAMPRTYFTAIGVPRLAAG